jgi:anaerobic magnesium-protoporphyrin IX monomethyl ester cyclase
VLAELTEINRDYDSYGFWDDTFTLSKPFVKAICRGLIEKELKKPWICMSRVDTVDDEMLLSMKQAGCRLIVYGVESGSERVLSILNKHITIPQIERAFRLTRQVGMESAGFFMLGTPGESYQDIVASMDLAQRLSPDYASFNITTPYPGTPLYRMLGERALEWVHSDALHAPGGKAQVLEELLRRAYRYFYFRPDYVARRLFRISRPRELFATARAGASVLQRYLVRNR